MGQPSYLELVRAARRHLRRRLRHLRAASRPDRRRLRRPRPRGLQRAARASPGPTSIDGMHEAFFDVGCRRHRDRHLRRVRRPPRRVRHRRPDLRASTSPRPASPRRWRRLLHPRRPALGRRLDRPRHQVRRRSATSASPSCATPTRCRRAACSTGGVDLLLVETAVRPPRAEGGDHRVPPGHGGRRAPGPDPGPGHHRADRPHAARHRDRRRPHRPRRHAARRRRPQLRHRPARDARAPPPPRPSTRPHADRRACPNAGLPSVVDGQDALRPRRRSSSPSTTPRFITELRRAASSAAAAAPTPEHLRAVVDAVQGPHARGAASPSTSPASTSIYTPRARSSRTPASWSSASAPTPTGRRRSARRCSPRTGTPA